MNNQALFKAKKAFIFGLDNVLYPEKDYLLQVYYLFSEFLAYIEQLDSARVLAFMQATYLQNGAEDIFEKTSAQFHLPVKYKENFLLLHETARLPLKLLMYKSVLSLMQDLVATQQQIFLLVDGHVAQQLNKMKQLEWHGLDHHLKVFFTQEFEAKPSAKALEFIAKSYNLSDNEILMIGYSPEDEHYAQQNNVDFIFVNQIL